MLTLYQYMHCPFCLRADMTANYHRIHHQKVYLLSDDKNTGYRLVGKKVVPILQLEDGTAMNESLDIVARLEGLSEHPAMLDGPDYASYLSAFEEYAEHINGLVLPRNIKIKQPEFSTQSARDFYQRQKEDKLGMRFTEALKQTRTYQQQVEKMLADLPDLELPSKRDNTLTKADVMVFPTLRNLTIVKDIAMTERQRTYLDEITVLTNTLLYDERAV